ncbi:hypothetical protein NX773_10260 [Massilia solisilvae]|uniref:Uncharacterized protein n=1 Tax=Massilia solisilvae TaxID=1811225 RepID=A0ABT2BJ58_9BURK|nr:hypothetical protein [Massilia solisilvae]MCS0608546.1 hypothetical protein [Massilia solisilvae]
MRPLTYACALLLPAIGGAQPYQFDLTGDQFIDMLAKQPVNGQEYRARRSCLGR